MDREAKLARLAAARARVAGLLTAAVVLVYFGFILLIWLSPTIQVDVLGHDAAWFPLKNPALVTLPLSFAIGMLVSLLQPEPEAAERHRRLARQMHLGHEGGDATLGASIRPSSRPSSS